MRHAFTMIEIVVMVIVIGIMAAVAVPKFIDSATESKVSATAEDLRLIETALGMYYARHGQYPRDLNRVQAAEAFDSFFKSENAFEIEVPIGGVYSYEAPPTTSQVQVSISPSASSAFKQKDAEQLDEYIDDGNLSTGSLRLQGNRLYYVAGK